ncbi:MAG: amidohydrolase [Actinobacteria bacterium]|nr:amidohydrolase [Actinomycetota bacterium]
MDSGERQLVIDLHAHGMPPDLPDMAAETGDARWPFLRVDDGAATGQVVRGADLFRVVRRSCWDTETRLAEMDTIGVDVHVISPIPVSLTYWAPARPALRYAQHVNDWLSAQVAAGEGRVRALGTVPLQDTDLAVAEMRRAVFDLGLDGLELGTVVGDQELDAPTLRPFFAAAAEWRVPLFLHPMDTGCVPRARSTDLAFGIGMLTDTALAAAALVFGGVLAEFPQLRVCLSHGGGGLPWMLPRLRFGRSIADPELDETWDALVARLFVDALVFDPRHLSLLKARFGPDHIVAGSDFPFLPDGPTPQAIVDAAGELGLLSPAERAAVKSANALAFLARR